MALIEGSGNSGKDIRDRAHGGGDFRSDEGNVKRKSGGGGWPPRGTAETRTDHPAGVPSAYRPHLARGESPTGAETTATSRSCHMRVRFSSLKWLPGDSALTVRRRDCYRSSSAGFVRIARPRT